MKIKITKVKDEYEYNGWWANFRAHDIQEYKIDIENDKDDIYTVEKHGSYKNYAWDYDSWFEPLENVEVKTYTLKNSSSRFSSSYNDNDNAEFLTIIRLIDKTKIGIYRFHERKHSPHPEDNYEGYSEYALLPDGEVVIYNEIIPIDILKVLNKANFYPISAVHTLKDIKEFEKDIEEWRGHKNGDIYSVYEIDEEFDIADYMYGAGEEPRMWITAWKNGEEKLYYKYIEEWVDNDSENIQLNIPDVSEYDIVYISNGTLYIKDLDKRK